MISDAKPLSLVSSRTLQASPAFAIKGSVCTLFVLHLKSADVAAIDHQLAQQLARSPGFLADAPLVVDFAELRDTEPALDIAELLNMLRKHRLLIVAGRNASSAQQESIKAAGLGVLPARVEAARPVVGEIPEERQIPTAVSPSDSEEPLEIEPAPAAVQSVVYRPTLVVNKPIRGGQQVYAEGGDLIVLGSLNAGAEILADGNIHVYGPLRGRALAGVRGDRDARIFCQGMAAELLSIAGIFRVMDELPAPDVRGKPARVYLDGERLMIAPL